jgi:hypothetical protein
MIARRGPFCYIFFSWSGTERLEAANQLPPPVPETTAPITTLSLSPERPVQSLSGGHGGWIASMRVAAIKPSDAISGNSLPDAGSHNRHLVAISRIFQGFVQVRGIITQFQPGFRKHASLTKAGCPIAGRRLGTPVSGRTF